MTDPMQLREIKFVHLKSPVTWTKINATLPVACVNFQKEDSFPQNFVLKAKEPHVWGI